MRRLVLLCLGMVAGEISLNREISILQHIQSNLADYPEDSVKHLQWSIQAVLDRMGAIPSQREDTAEECANPDITQSSVTAAVTSYGSYGKIVHCGCDMGTIDDANEEGLHSVLQRLRVMPFFKIFKVALGNECPFWQDSPGCNKPTCTVCECPQENVPQSWLQQDAFQEQQVSQTVDRTMGLFHLEPWTQEDDMWIVHDAAHEMTYVDLTANPEGYTGYEGDAARRIWDTIYHQNCFQKDVADMCYEERVFHRLISGLHASISCHISKNYLQDGASGPNIMELRRRVGWHPERVNNLYFVYVFLLRAVGKARDVLFDYPYDTGNSVLDAETSGLVQELLDQPLLRSCDPGALFDEASMFHTYTEHEDIEEQRGYQNAFRNISRVMDCVDCEKCRMYGKLQVLGLGTAMKVLFQPNIQVVDLQRSEVMALLMTLAKLSDSVKFLRSDMAKL